MYVIKFILLCLGVAFTGASLFQIKYEKSVVLFFMGLIVILHQAYIFDMVYVCSIGIVMAIGMGGVLGIVKTNREKSWKTILKSVFDPVFVSYVIALSVIWYIVRLNQVHLIDELHLWGALPKILFFENGRQQLTDSLLLTYNNYMPGMPLFLYFLEFVNGSFKEALLYFGYTALGSMILMEGFSGKLTSFRKWYLIPGISIAVCLLPLMFYNNIYNDHAIYFKSIHVDAVLGIFVGYATWLLAKKSWQNLWDLICFLLALSVIVLLKASGIMFAAIIGTAASFHIIIKDRQHIKKTPLLIGTPIFMYLEWSTLLKIKNVAAVTDYSITDIFSTQYLKDFLYLLWNRELIYLPEAPQIAKITSWGIFFIMLCALSVISCMMMKKAYYYYACGIMIFEVVAYTAGIYGLFAGSFHGMELSYARYICTGLTGFLCFLAIILFNNSEIVKKYTIFWVFPVVLLIILFPKMKPQGIAYPLSALQDADKFEAMINQTGVYDTEKRGKILLIMDDDYNSYSPDLYLYFWRRLYFNLLDEDKKVAGCRFTDTYIDSMQINGKKAEIYLSGEEVTEEFDYIYKIDYVNEKEKVGNVYKIAGQTEKMYFLELIETVSF